MPALNTSPQPAPETAAFSLLLRLIWMVAGHFAIFILAMLIASNTNGALSWRDGAVAASVAIVLASRYLDITRYGGLTADGEPATLAHLRSHALRLIAISAALTAIAHVAAAR